MNAPHGVRLEDWIRDLYRQGRIYRFYKCDEWLRLRNLVLEQAHNECEECRKRGKYTRAKVVHHVNEVRDRPDLALSMWYTDAQGERHRNLKALCMDCHEIEHERAYKGRQAKKGEQLNEERW